MSSIIMEVLIANCAPWNLEGRMPGEFANSGQFNGVLQSLNSLTTQEQIFKRLVELSDDTDVSGNFSYRQRIVEFVNSRSLNDQLVEDLLVLLVTSRVSPLITSLSKLNLFELYTFEILLTITKFIKNMFKQNLCPIEIEASLGQTLKGFWEHVVIPKSLGHQLEHWSHIFVFKYYAKTAGMGLFETIANQNVTKAEQAAAVFDRQVHLKNALIDIMWSELLKDLESRLLAPFIETEDIVNFIGPAKEILTIIDPSAHLLEKYLCKTALYLKQYRGISFGKVVVEYIKALSKVDPAFFNGKRISIDAPDIDQRNFDSPMLGEIRQSTKSGDMFSILANIFDSMSDMIKYFKQDLVERICSDERTNFDSVANFSSSLRSELAKLKSKFDGEEWRDCEVIINDLEASQHLTANSLQVVRVSQLFWPEFEADSFFMPQSVLSLQKKLLEDYLAANNPKKYFEWTNSFSQVDLDIAFENTILSVKCNADEASVLILIIEHKALSLERLSALTGFNEGRVTTSLSKWIRSRIIRDNHGNFSVVDTYEEGPLIVDAHTSCWSSASADSAAPSTDLDPELMRNFPLVCGVLTNLGAMPLGSIHSHLKKVSVNYQCQESDLHTFLEIQVTQGRLKHTSEGFFDVIQRM